MRKVKRIFALVFAVICIVATVMNPLTSNASVSEVEVMIFGEGGTFQVGTDSGEDWYQSIGADQSLKSAGFSITDPVFFDPAREFLGWKICEEKQVYNAIDGSTNTEWWPITGTNICTTEELMNYVITGNQSQIAVFAQWKGEDSLYYSEFGFDMYGGVMDIVYQDVYTDDAGNTIQNNIVSQESYWGTMFRKNSGKIKDQMDQMYDFSATPTKAGGATFQGWLEFRRMHDGRKLISEKLYKTSEIFEKTVPEYDVLYMAKWSDVPIEEYCANTLMNQFWTVDGDLFGTLLDADGKLVDEKINGMLGVGCAEKPTVGEALAASKATIHSIEKQCAAFEGWTAIEYEYSEAEEVPTGTSPSVTDGPNMKVVFGGTIYDREWDVYNDIWLKLYNYTEYKNKSTEDIMKLDGTKNHYFMANWKETHTGVLNDAKKATCTTAGYTGDEVCSGCDKLLEKGHDIAAIGHTYKNGVCINCNDQLVVAGNIENVDTSKPSDSVKSVVENDAVNSVMEKVKKLVDAIMTGTVTEEMRNTFSVELISAIEKEIKAGNKILTEITAIPVTEDKVDSAIANEIKKNLGENDKLAQYLDLTIMIKSVSNDGTEKELGTLNVLEEEISFTIVIPTNLVQNGRTFFILRNHEGKVDKLSLSKNADGSYSFKTDRFSTYALAYEDVKSTISVSNSSNTSNNVPHTGDNNNALLYGTMLMLALTAMIVAKKKSF